MTLQSIDVAGLQDGNGMRGHIAEAIYSLRRAIDELRDAQSRGASGLALGFVLARGRRNAAVEIDPVQPSPRRTA
jgi:signal transduction histidine kinase